MRAIFAGGFDCNNDEVEKKLEKLRIVVAAWVAGSSLRLQLLASFACCADLYAEVILRLIVAANDDEIRMTLSEYAYTDTDVVLVEDKLAINSLDAIVFDTE